MKKKISSEIINRFFEEDIPYRLDMMNAYDCKIWMNPYFQSCSDYTKLRISSVEASRIIQRVFIQFMELSVDRKTGKLINLIKRKDDDDVLITDLGGKKVDLKNLADIEKDILVKAYITGNKSTEHLTFNPKKNTGYPEVLEPGAKLINKLLKENLFEREK